MKEVRIDGYRKANYEREESQGGFCRKKFVEKLKKAKSFYEYRCLFNKSLLHYCK